LSRFEVENFTEAQLARNYLFQLKETKDIERITFILEMLTTKKQSLLKILQKNKLKVILKKLTNSYFEGEYGIDQSDF
jgi:hypothetical protein